MQDMTEGFLEDRQTPRETGRETGLSGRLTRQDRQARVGILRNPASAPRPPARRAQLTGRWLNLRSSRRPAGAEVAQAAEAVVTALTADHKGPRPVVPVRRAADGSVQSIDIAGLMASVDDLGTRAPVRAAFAAPLRGDSDPAPASAAPRKPPILTAAAWIGEDDSDEDDDALAAAFRASDAPIVPQKPRRRRRHVLRIVSLGIALAAVALILLPAWGALLPA